MSFTVRYTGDKAAKLAKALRDCLDWLPAGPAADLRVTLQHTARHKGARVAFRQGYFYLDFAGVRGLPARAFIRDALRAP